MISGFCRRNFNSEIKITNHGTIPGRTLELYTTTKKLLADLLIIVAITSKRKPTNIPTAIDKIATLGTSRFERWLKKAGTWWSIDSLYSIRLRVGRGQTLSRYW